MSHTNSTTNYALPQFITTDKPAWLTDINTAYSAIDTAMKNNADAATTAGNNAVQALSDASAASNAAATADAKGAGAIASISDQFDSTATYTINSVVIYNNLLYICTVAVTTPGAWTGSDNWDRITVEDLLNTKASISAIPTNVSQLANDAGYLTPATTPINKSTLTWGTSLVVTSNAFQYLVISSDTLYVVWFAGTNDVWVTNQQTNERASGTGSATNGTITAVRTGTGLTITSSASTSLTIIY